MKRYKTVNAGYKIQDEKIQDRTLPDLKKKIQDARYKIKYHTIQDTRYKIQESAMRNTRPFNAMYKAAQRKAAAWLRREVKPVSLISHAVVTIPFTIRSGLKIQNAFCGS